MKTGIRNIILAILGFVATGCAARTPDVYRDHMTKFLAPRDLLIRDCYLTRLAENPKLEGTVVVNVTISNEDGLVTATPDATSTAPRELIECVTVNFAALKFEPVDFNAGQTTRTYAFHRASPQ